MKHIVCFLAARLSFFVATTSADDSDKLLTGYGRSTRPAPMNDPCNVAKDRQAGLVTASCPPSYSHALSTMASDRDEVGAVC